MAWGLLADITLIYQGWMQDPFRLCLSTCHTQTHTLIQTKYAQFAFCLATISHECLHTTLWFKGFSGHQNFFLGINKVFWTELNWIADLTAVHKREHLRISYCYPGFMQFQISLLTFNKNVKLIRTLFCFRCLWCPFPVLNVVSNEIFWIAHPSCLHSTVTMNVFFF